MKKIILLGATGSIGLQTIDVVLKHPNEFEVVALSVGRNISELIKILSKVKVKHVCVQEREDYEKLKENHPNLIWHVGDEGLCQLAQLKDYDVLVNALVGFVGLKPTVTAIQNHKDIALANKETLVVAGELIQQLVNQYHVQLLPIDSEHSAIFQCLSQSEQKFVKKLIITASGGSFRNYQREQLKNVTVQDALKHPNWQMGDKITIDSATMMNKGFEVIEAHYLFNVPYEKIEVVLHPESIVHSMAEFYDGSVIAQIGNADMRLPIQYALSYPKRLPLYSDFSLTQIGTLHFQKMDFKRFPLLQVAYEVGQKKGNLPCVLNAVNEVANLAFRNGEIGFLEIEDIIQKALLQTPYETVESLEQLIEIDKKARFLAKSLIKGDI